MEAILGVYEKQGIKNGHKDNIQQGTAFNRNLGYAVPESRLVVTQKISTCENEMPFEADDVAVFDRGYVDYGYFASLNGRKVWFVIRLKKNVKFKRVKQHETAGKNIIFDYDIIMPAYSPRERLRKIILIDKKTGKKIAILTNNVKWPAGTIAAVYKGRWQIELFVKAVKQNLKIKRFYGNSRNAVLIQIWTALV
jgi:hypothetical protein